MFLAVVLTTAYLEPDAPDPPEAGEMGCGTCRLCIDACPTQALTASDAGGYALDARRCISYLTIELRGAIPVEWQSRMGDWVFGCDICQEVCPYNRHVTPTREPAFQAEAGVGPALPLADVLSLPDDASFTAAFRNTPLLRPKRAGLVRNAAIVADNLAAVAKPS